MVDRYANKEDATATEKDDRPHQKEKKDNPESSKSKNRKRKGDDMVAAVERSWPPRTPHMDDFEKVMESLCSFHPKGKNVAKDCFTLKKYVEEHSKHPARNQDGSNRNKDQQPDGPVF